MKRTLLPLLLSSVAFLPVSGWGAEPVPFRFLLPTVTVSEGETVAVLEVVRADDSDHPIKVDFMTEALSATSGVDYTPTSGTLTFAPGEHFKLIQVPILNDGLTEPPETFRVVLTNSTGNAISQEFGRATVTINDNDPGIQFESSIFRVVEAETEAVVTVRRGTDAPGRITVDYAVEPDTASPSVDYLPVSGTLVFEESDQVRPIRIPIRQDSLAEAAETFRVGLSNPSGGVSLGKVSSASVLISDNDQGFSFPSVAYSVLESQPEISLSVSRSSDAAGESTVEYSTEGISATPDLDYIPVRGTLVFATGEASKTIKIPIINDGLKENIETFRVLLSNPSAGTMLGPQNATIVRIEDNDTGFSFAGGSSYTLSESSPELSLSVYRGSDRPGQVTVDYSIEPSSATADQDYLPAKGTLIFAPNEMVQTFTISLVNDTVKEPNETFRVLLSNPSTGTSLGSPSSAIIRVQDDDTGFIFNPATYAVSESQKEILLSVSRGTAVGESSVGFSVQPGTATPDVDYSPLTGVLTFHDGEFSQNIRVSILPDSVKEPAETFQVILSDPSPGTFVGSPSAATVRILDDDPGFTFANPNYVTTESSTNAVVTVYRGTDLPTPVSVDYLLEPNSATATLDYIDVKGTLIFAPGEYYKTIAIPIVNDAIGEGNESFFVILTNASPGTSIGVPARTTIVIQDNDVGFAFATPSLPNLVSPAEDEPYARVDVIIQGDFVLTNSVSVDFTTSNGNATPNIDYLAQSGTLTFLPGEKRQTITVPILNDGLYESDETFRILLHDPVGLPVSSPAAFTITIHDNERGFSVLPNNPAGTWIAPEDSGDLVLHIFRESDFGLPASVHWRTSDWGEFQGFSDQGTTATPGKDFVPGSGTINFGPGETDKTITVHLLDDDRAELNERFYIVLSDPSPGERINESARLVVVEDNEPNPLILDPGFRPDFYYARGSNGSDDQNLQVMPDGRIVMAIQLWRLTGEDGVGVVRLLPDGSADPGFQLARASGMQILALMTNGQVLVAGPPDLTINGQPRPHLARLNTDGSLDPAFLVQFPKPLPTVFAVAAATDGKILVALDNTIVRLEKNGAIDSSFQTARVDGPVRQISVDPSGRALIFGELYGVNGKGRPQLARLLPDGALDEAFLSEWRFGNIQRMALETDGTILISYYDNDLAATRLLRLNSDGVPDETFKPDPAIVSFDNFSAFFAESADHKVLFARQLQYGSGVVSRLNPDGSNDLSFHEGTYTVTFPSAGGWSSFYSVSVEPSGNLLLKGDLSSVNGQPVSNLTRLLLNASSPPIMVDPASSQVRETNGLVAINLLRTGNSSAAYAVNWSTEGGTAQAGSDFVATNGTVTFAPGDSVQTISIPLLRNLDFDEDRTLGLRFATPGGLALPASFLTILNDDLAFTPGTAYAFPNGRFLMNITGRRPGLSTRLQRSSDLVNWEDFLQVGDPQILDPESGAGSPGRRFYRLIQE